MLFETIKLTFQQHIAWVTLNRTEKLNAINRQMLQEIDEALLEIERNGEVRVIIFSGNGKVFAAGADIEEISTYHSSFDLYETTTLGHRVFKRLEELSIPSVAAVHGLAFGGGFELSLACDFRIVTTNAKFGIPEIKLGLIPGWGGASRLQKMLPMPIFKEMLLTGEPIAATKAATLGLVNHVVDEEHLLMETEKFAQLLLDKSPVTMKFAKQLANTQLNTDLQTAIEFEKQTITLLYDTEDRHEGVHAFVEKRAPQWVGK